MRFRPYSSPEFPNDNHQLHLGASWVCLTPTGSPRAVMRAPQRAEEPTLVPLTPLPPRVAETVVEVQAPSSRIPLPPASVVQSLLRRSPDGMGFTICVPNAQLLDEWERPARTDELHLTQAPGPLLSSLLERFDTLSFAGEVQGPAAHPSDPCEPLTAADQSPETRRSPEACAGVLEPEASVPPPVAELIDELPPSTPLNEAQREDDDRALSAELFEVLKTLEIIDSDTEFAPFDAPASDVHAAPVITRSAVDDLADAVAEALCAEFGASGPGGSRATPIPAEAIEARAEETANDAAPDHYADFIAALCEVAMAGGATRAAAVLPRLLEGKLLDSSALSDDVQECLQQAGIATLRGSCIEPSDDFKANASAWARVLSGASDDLSACGDTLDGFAAGLLGALLGPGSDTKGLRRELRKRGVAAFGMLSVAA